MRYDGLLMQEAQERGSEQERAKKAAETGLYDVSREPQRDQGGQQRAIFLVRLTAETRIRRAARKEERNQGQRRRRRRKRRRKKGRERGVEVEMECLSESVSMVMYCKQRIVHLPWRHFRRSSGEDRGRDCFMAAVMRYQCNIMQAVIG